MQNTEHRHIQLNRTFHALSDYARESDDVDLSQAFHVGKRLEWEDLYREYRVILLSEAGSGKTEEIGHAAEALRSAGKPSFFLRLEHVADDFDIAFEVGTLSEFEGWLLSQEEGWIFLDSVDEARLKSPSDFERAIKKLSQRISIAKARSHIFITGRPHAWRPKTDMALCERHFPPPQRSKSESDEDGKENQSSSIKTIENDSSTAEPKFKILVLDNLSPEQIAKFLAGNGITDTEAFMHAVERVDAWSFTSRPQDLQEVAEFWIDNGRIGSRLELMRNSIRRRLQERDQARAEAYPISEKEALDGARMLAAATTFAKEPTIRVPDGSENSGGVAVSQVLPEWDDKKINALLARPIFDEAIYGTVRFHHRSVREYLAAEWIAQLLSRNTSHRAVFDLIFKTQYGLNVITPSTRPLLPWLAIMDDGVREHIQKTCPEVIFEGGDPSQLPLETRQSALLEVCEQLEGGTSNRVAMDIQAAQRFAKKDLEGDIRSLLAKYEGHNDISAFLMKMVWLGELTSLLPEAKMLALNTGYSVYVRTLALRAAKAIGRIDDVIDIRDGITAESPSIGRQLLADLIAGLAPTNENLQWLINALAKAEKKEKYTVDHLSNSTQDFIAKVPEAALPDFISGVCKLLKREPFLEKRHCEVSERHSWLLPFVATALVRLIGVRHPFCLNEQSLSVLHMVSAVHFHDIDDLRDVEHKLGTLVPEWEELNRAAFWHSVETERKLIDKSEKRLTNFWQAGSYRCFWKFGEADFEYTTTQVSEQSEIDNQLVALSLAIRIYSDFGRPKAWLRRMKKSVTADEELADRLQTFLHPPPMSDQEKAWKKQEASWKHKEKERQAKEAKNRQEWKEQIASNLDELRSSADTESGLITNSQYYFHERMREEDDSHSKWTNANPELLIPELGVAAVEAFKEGVKAYWRRNTPKTRAEGAPANRTSFSTIFGLTGLSLEFRDDADCADKFSTEQVDLACRYASHELNGFPDWFPALFQSHSKQVADFLFTEIQYELRTAKKNSHPHYILSDVQWSGDWAWEAIAPKVLEYLEANEPKNFEQLCQLLAILQGSQISDEKLASLAKAKCSRLRRADHLAAWFAVLVGVSPQEGLEGLTKKLASLNDSQHSNKFAMTFLTCLTGHRRSPGIAARQNYVQPTYLKVLYLLMHQYIRREDDIERAGRGAYSPELRDDAQEARDKLFNLLTELSGKEVFIALEEIADEFPDRPWLKRLLLSRAEKDADLPAWTATQVADFYEHLDRTPSNHRELADLALMRFHDLKDNLEHGDDSVASVVIKADQETDLRNFIGHSLRTVANGRYSIPQEEELADAKRPDLRFLGMGFDAPVPVELKIADNWTGPALFERLENQLCGDYLRDNRSARGIFVLVYRGKKQGWDVPNAINRVDFAGLVVALEFHWKDIANRYSAVDDIFIVGIDLTRRSN